MSTALLATWRRCPIHGIAVSFGATWPACSRWRYARCWPERSPLRRSGRYDSRQYGYLAAERIMGVVVRPLA